MSLAHLPMQWQLSARQQQINKEIKLMRLGFLYTQLKPFLVTCHEASAALYGAKWRLMTL